MKCLCMGCFHVRLLNNDYGDFCIVSELLHITSITSCSVCACFSLKGAGFPLHLLPQCMSSGGVAGHTCLEWHGIPAGTPVGAALGDFQCSVYSCMSARTDAGETGSPVMSLLTGSCSGNITPLQSTPFNINDIIANIIKDAIFYSTVNQDKGAVIFCTCCHFAANICSKSRPDIRFRFYVTTFQIMNDKVYSFLHNQILT